MCDNTNEEISNDLELVSICKNLSDSDRYIIVLTFYKKDISVEITDKNTPYYSTFYSTLDNSTVFFGNKLDEILTKIKAWDTQYENDEFSNVDLSDIKLTKICREQSKLDRYFIELTFAKDFIYVEIVDKCNPYSTSFNHKKNFVGSKSNEILSEISSYFDRNH